MDFIREWFSNFELIIAGIVGGLLSTRWGRRKDDPKPGAWDVACFIVTGAACANYLTGFAVWIFHMTEPGTIKGAAFLIGVVGGSLLAALLRTIQDADGWKLLADVVRARFGGNKE